MSARSLTREQRLASIREVLRAANGDWHEATALWSIGADLTWLLDLASAPAQPQALDVERLARAIEAADALDDALVAYAKSLRRKAVAAGKTWVGRHWPDTRQLGRDGVGVDFSERGPAVRSYLAAVEPAVMVELLDAFLAARRWIAADPPSVDSERLREALRAYVVAQGRMLDRWAEVDDAVKRDLWQKLHACEEPARSALEATPPDAGSERPLDWRDHLNAIRRQLVGTPPNVDGIDAAIGYALNDCETAIDAALPPSTRVGEPLRETEEDQPMSVYELTDRDRGAIAALNLLARADEAHEGEEDWQTTASDIIAAIEREGLPTAIRFQMDAETDFMTGEDESVEDLYGAFPADLAAIAAEAPHTTWRGVPAAESGAGSGERER